MQYEKDNFRFRGTGWVDKNRNWGIGATFRRRFRRSFDQMGLVVVRNQIYIYFPYVQRRYKYSNMKSLNFKVYYFDKC